MSTSTDHPGVKTENRLLPRTLLDRVGAGGQDLKGSAPADYHLPVGERLGDAASRKWLYLRGVYQAFRAELAALPKNAEALTETREHWLQVLLSELGFGRVPLRRAGLPEDDGKYPVSHLREHIPIHLLGWNDSLDKAGTNRRAPQSMFQEFLNVNDEYLWGLLSNGRQLRLLRDSKALTGSAYVQFDLEAIFDGELYSDFFLLFALLHDSRFELLSREDGGTPTNADCWLERWRVESSDEGVRARDRLRDAVKAALEALGTGFMKANPGICEDLASGDLRARDFQHELLRLAYQLIFIFATEERGVLLDPEASEEARDTYRRYFSATRLRRIARRRTGDRNTDLWHAQVHVLDALGAEEKHEPLGLPGLGGLFFRYDPHSDIPNGSGFQPQATDPLRAARLPNEHLLAAVRHLDETFDEKGRRTRVNYRDLDAEELGSVFESLLEVEPKPDVPNQRFVLEDLAGSLRKTTGSYYTPRALIDSLLDTALDPVLDRAVAASGKPEDLLRLRVCDPACGSGAFLVAAAQRIAARYAALKTEDSEPTPLDVSDAMHEVVQHCVFGVDINHLAVELAQVSLWLASQTPGKPLAFLDHHVKAGNALLGATPALLAPQEIPDGAFKPIDGDDPRVAATLRGSNEKTRKGQGTFFDLELVPVSGNAKFAQRAREIARKSRPTVAETRQQIREHREMEADPELREKKRVANAWCAAFVWPKYAGAPDPVTTERFRELLAESNALSTEASAELDWIASRYQFFHWHLEFPDVFSDEDATGPDGNPAAGWSGGFDCVIGNPPWERVKLQEQEFFASRDEKIAKAKTAAIRKKMIEDLPRTGEEADQRLFNDFHVALRRSDGISQLLRESGRYKLTGHGDINTYAVFAETARTVVHPDGRAGLVLPTGIGTDATTSEFFGDVVQKNSLAAFLEFENEAFLLSKAVHHSFRFCLLTMTGRAERGSEAEARFAFGLRYIADLGARTLKRPPGDLLLVNPNTGTTPLFRLPDDARITFDIYQRVPVLWRDEPNGNLWNISFMAMFHMANDSGLFRTEEDLREDGWVLDGNVFTKHGQRMLPLVEAKMIHHFDHRFGTYTGQTEKQANMGTLPRPGPEEKSDPWYRTMPRYWVQEFQTKDEERSKKLGKDVYIAGVNARLETRHWARGWLLGWRDICRSTDERTMIAAAVPRTAVPDGTLLMLPSKGSPAALQANLSSFVFDYVTRQKSGGTHLKYFTVKQLPVLPPEQYDAPAPWAPATTLAEWIEARVLELTYTSWDLEPFAHDMGDDGPPFVWDEKRRTQLRAELDAAFFHLYSIARDDVRYIMDTFPVTKDRDEKIHGTYRTRDLILDCYDAMSVPGEPYASPLKEPPGEGRRHPAR